MEFVLATNNRKKLQELARLLAGSGHSFISLAEAGAFLPEEEGAESFAENALGKARAVCRQIHRPSLADDSGLEVQALGGAPGVLSARFAGRRGDDEANNHKLMALLERTPYAKRGARFVCAMALVMPDGGELVCEGSVEGSIGFAPSGSNGFGYDPLFYINNESFADMSDEAKDQISHRAAAVRSLLLQMPPFLAQHGGE